MSKIITFFLIVVSFQLSLQAREINLDKLIDTAKKTDKHIFVWLHKNGCGYCQRMKEFTLDDNAIKKIIDKNFITISINIHDRDHVRYRDFKGSAREFAIDVGYDFYPSSLFINKDGNIIYEVAGYRDEKVFKMMLDYVKSGIYENTDFSDYKDRYIK